MDLMLNGDFIPEYTPSGLDEFTRGYFEAAEWTQGLEERETARMPSGFSPSAISQGTLDCESFQEICAQELQRYCELTQRSMLDAGRDYWLTRNYHGAGFWSRGSHPVLLTLTDNAHADGQVHVHISEIGKIHFG